MVEVSDNSIAVDVKKDIKKVIKILKNGQFIFRTVNLVKGTFIFENLKRWCIGLTCTTFVLLGHVKVAQN